jgi:hypothetical protein
MKSGGVGYGYSPSINPKHTIPETMATTSQHPPTMLPIDATKPKPKASAVTQISPLTITAPLIASPLDRRVATLDDDQRSFGLRMPDSESTHCIMARLHGVNLRAVETVFRR